MILHATSYSRQGHVATVGLDRPDAENRINAQVAAELKGIFQDIANDKEIRVVVITGKGENSFCAGTDHNDFFSQDDQAKRIDLFSVATSIERIDCPVIAAINGACLEQGFELALACDLRICSEEAVFRMAQTQDRLMPWDGGTQRLARLLGRTKAMELLLLGKQIEAQEAFRFGLVNQVVPQSELQRVVQDRANSISQQSPVSMAYAKEAVQKGLDLTLDQGLRLEADLYFLMHTTIDRTEGIRAFREKRKPSFRGE